MSCRIKILTYWDNLEKYVQDVGLMGPSRKSFMIAYRMPSQILGYRVSMNPKPKKQRKMSGI